MVEIGKINKLTVKAIGSKEVTFIADDDEEIKVPAEEFKEMPQEGDVVKIFLYKDANRKTIGSAKFPYAIAGEFEFLSVTQVSSAGALLDWGLKRKLFLPSKEQTSKIALGNTYLVHVFYDHKTEQVIASMHVDDFLGLDQPHYEMNDEVEILVVKETDLGYKVIVDDAYWGLIYHSEIFEHIDFAMRTKAYVKCVREDGKLDIALQPQGYKVVDTISEQILEELKRRDGYLPMNDKTDSDIIYNTFGCSKKAFKKTLGTLYKQRIITIGDDGIRLNDED